MSVKLTYVNLERRKCAMNHRDDEKTTDNQGVASRVRMLMGEMPLRKFAAKVGVKESTLRGILQGRSPYLETVAAIAEGAGVDFRWLATGKGGPENFTESNEIVRAPVLSWRLPPAEEGQEPPRWSAQTAISGYLPLSVELLRELGISPSAARLMWMERSRDELQLRAGDCLLIDAERCDPLAGGLYVFTVPGSSFATIEHAKPVAESGDVQVMLGKHGPFAPEDIERLDILGRVVWIWRRAR